MLNELNEIKIHLHDAPSEVKSAYNTVVNYFESKSFIVDAISKLKVIVKDRLFMMIVNLNLLQPTQ